MVGKRVGAVCVLMLVVLSLLLVVIDDGPAKWLFWMLAIDMMRVRGQATQVAGSENKRRITSRTHKANPSPAINRENSRLSKRFGLPILAWSAAEEIWGFPKIRGTLLWVPIIRTIVQ